MGLLLGVIGLATLRRLTANTRGQGVVAELSTATASVIARILDPNVPAFRRPTS